MRRRSATADGRREEAIRLALLLTPPGQIAKALRVGADRVSDILSEPGVQQRIADARRTALVDAQAQLRASARRAAGVLDAALDSKDPRVAVRAAIEILTKSGADAPKRNEHTGADGTPLHLFDRERAREELVKRVRTRYADPAVAEKVIAELLGS